ncbi:MAG: hypothetical protein IK138_08860 [Lachnospiraceae bacterium]|nr:hypothetical protein [Lachnospiraceae bacterium]
MEELYKKLNAIPGCYFAFVLGVTDYCRRSPERLKNVMDYLNVHTNLSTSDVIEFLIYQPGFLDEESIENDKQLVM